MATKGQGQVTQPDNNEAAIVPPRAFDRFVNHLANLAEIEESGSGDSSLIMESVLNNILGADSFDEAIAAQDAGIPSGKSLCDVELRIHDFTVAKGDEEYEEHGLGYYYRVNASILETGEDIQFAVGAPNVLAVLMRARNDGELPGNYVLRGKKVKRGILLTIKRVPARAL
jgi:hypothetical protein